MDIIRMILVVLMIYFLGLSFNEPIHLLFAMASLGLVGHLNALHKNEELIEDNIKDVSNKSFIIRFFLWFKRPSLYQTWIDDLEATYFKNWFGQSVRYKKEISGKETIYY